MSDLDQKIIDIVNHHQYIDGEIYPDTMKEEVVSEIKQAFIDADWIQPGEYYSEDGPAAISNILLEKLISEEVECLTEGHTQHIALAEMQARANALYEAADLVKDEPHLYQVIMRRRINVLNNLKEATGRKPKEEA